MNDSPDATLGAIHIPRYLIDAHHVVVAIAPTDGLFRAYLDHAKRWDREPDQLEAVFMRQLLAGTSLYLSQFHKRENIAFTIHVPEPATNLFAAGDVIDGFITARLFTDGIAKVDEPRLYCHVQQPGAPMRETVIDVEGLDVLVMLEAFTRRSDQHTARFFDYDDGRSAMVLSLPGVNETWLNALDRDAALALIDEGQLLETREFRFACGCSETKMLEVVRSVYEDRYDELFQGEEGIEVQCPRCGHEWLLRRDDFTAGSDGSEAQS